MSRALRATASSRAVIPISLGGFVLLGLPDGALGVAWPSMRAGYGLPLAALGLLSLGAAVGYLLSSAFSGAVTTRLGTRRTVMLAAAGGGAALLVMALAPVFEAMVCAVALLGLGMGSLDAGVNSFIALRRQPAVMNLLHACYGTGTLLGPLLVTGVLLAGTTWRAAYGALAALDLLLLAAAWLQREGWAVERSDPPPVRGAAAVPAPAGWSFRFWLSLGLFFVYTGLEVAAGQWSYSLLTGPRGQTPAVAGVLTACYWGGLTGGRLAAAGLSRRLSPGVLLQVSMAVAAAGAALFWWDLNPVLGSAGLPLLGLGLAAVFPALVTLTPARVGASRTAHAVGYQLAAANVGGALLPALAGLVLQRFGLEALGPYLAAFTLAMVLLNLALGRGRPASVRRAAAL